MIAGVNNAMVRPLHATSMELGDQTWVAVDEAKALIPGQKIDFTGDLGVQWVKADGQTKALEGTYLVAEVDPAGNRLRLMDAIDRKAVKTAGTYTGKGEVATYYLVGPNYFYFFTGLMVLMGIVYIFVARAYKEKTHVRTEGNQAPPAEQAA
jgi:proton-dependent oligopeptide transporter, POT family